MELYSNINMLITGIGDGGCDSGDLCCLAHPPQGIEILER